MIKLTKTAKPKVLEDHENSWTKLVLDKLARGEKLTDTEKGKYRHPEIKAALRAETHEKCAYCESKITHVSFGDVEHVIPKKISPELWFVWDNLTLACEVCNNKKGTYDQLIDPYKQDPGNHFYFEGAVIAPRPGDETAHVTEITLELNRGELIEQRKKRRDYIYGLFEILVKSENPERKNILREFIEKDQTNAAREYAAMSRDLIRRYFELIKPISIENDEVDAS